MGNTIKHVVKSSVNLKNKTLSSSVCRLGCIDWKKLETGLDATKKTGPSVAVASFSEFHRLPVASLSKFSKLAKDRLQPVVTLLTVYNNAICTVTTM
jgi:hypothetical protein